MPHESIGTWFAPVAITVFWVLIALQIFYFRYRCLCHRLTLREIAEQIVEAKTKYADYPIASLEDVEPTLFRTIAKTYEIPLSSLNRETRPEADLGFVW